MSSAPAEKRTAWIASGRSTILIVSILHLAGGMLHYLLNRPAEGTEPDGRLAFSVAVYLGLGVVFLAFWVWAKFRPLIPTILTLALFVALHGWVGISDPGTLYQGAIIKVLVLFLLARAVYSVLFVKPESSPPSPNN